MIHCRIIIEELEKRNIDPEIIHCIASHGPRYFGVEPKNSMDKMIYVFDELSGFIHASALIRPTRYEGMDSKSVLKKLKTPSFAAQVNREDISDAIFENRNSFGRYHRLYHLSSAKCKIIP